MTARSNKIRIVLGLLLLVLLVPGISVFRKYADRKLPNFRKETHLYVYPDTPLSEVLAFVRDSCGARRPKSAVRVFAEVEPVLKPGHYVIPAGAPSVYVPRMLRHGWQTPVPLVLSGTMRLKGAIARKIANQLLLDSASMHAALCDKELLGRFGFTPQDVFSMMLPDSYQIYWTATPEEVLASQKKAWDAFWTDERRSLASAAGLTPKKVSVLASIVQSETNYAPEMPSVAGVYLNRLAIGQKLEADPTVAFCFDYEPRRILKRHLEVDSPYNTYKYAGLPPGPICVPSKECLEAVLHPDRHGYLYFCASPAMDGTHRFATTYNEHLRNAAAFRRALDARR